MNLITDAWIPIRRKSGKMKLIAPWQVTDDAGGDIITSLAAVRPDFNGALIQFLIGLLQTTCPYHNQRQWRLWREQPPHPDELQAAFEPVAFAFYLDGDGPRFMQDFTLAKEVRGLSTKQQEERKSQINELLIDTPTGKTLEDNTDHFIKRGRIKQLCSACAAMSLFTLQTNAPEGGSGHYTGLRGGGPLTTLILTDNLWMTCWLNVLERERFLSLANQDKNKDSDRFPWLEPTRTSENGRKTTNDDVHPDQIFWSMPRRIHLIFSNENKDVVCDICSKQDFLMVKYFLTKKNGVSYKGPWIHPLSPYSNDNKNVPVAFHLKSGGIGYRHWLGLIQSYEESKKKRQPAHVIENFFNMQHISQIHDGIRLWAFGYNMDHKKALCWYDITMPIVLIEEDIRKTYENHIKNMVNCAEQISSNLRDHIKKAIFRPEINRRGDLSFITNRFWQETEGFFYTSLYLLRDSLSQKGDVITILENWYKHLVHVAEVIFNDISQPGAFDAADPKRVALAWCNLQKSIHNKKLKEQLGLPVKIKVNL